MTFQNIIIIRGIPIVKCIYVTVLQGLFQQTFNMAHVGRGYRTSVPEQFQLQLPLKSSATYRGVEGTNESRSPHLHNAHYFRSNNPCDVRAGRTQLWVRSARLIATADCSWPFLIEKSTTKLPQGTSKRRGRFARATVA